MTNRPEASVKRLDIARAVAERLGTLSVTQVDQVIEVTFNEIARQVYAGKVVKISGYAIFERVIRQARVARNPRTGEVLKVKSKKVLRFRPGTRLSQAAAHTHRPDPVSFERTPAQRKAAARKERERKAAAAKKRAEAVARAKADIEAQQTSDDQDAASA